jgi:hypothetical protein
MEQLRGIGDTTVIAEIFDLIDRELEAPPRTGPLTGVLPDRDPPVWYRRLVPLHRVHYYQQFTIDDDCDEFRNQACDYVITYRRMTSDERIQHQVSTRAVVVTGVWHNAELARLYIG